MSQLAPIRTRSFEIATLTSLITQLDRIHSVLSFAIADVECWKQEQVFAHNAEKQYFMSFTSVVAGTLTGLKAYLESGILSIEEPMIHDSYMEKLSEDITDYLNSFNDICQSLVELLPEKARAHYAIISKNLGYLCSMFVKTIENYLSAKPLVANPKAPIPQTEYTEEPVTIGTSTLSAIRGFTRLKVEATDVPGVNVVKITGRLGFGELRDKFDSEDLFSFFRDHNVIAIYYNWEQHGGSELDQDACKAMDEIYEKYGIEFSDVERNLSTSFFGGMVARIDIA